MKKVIIKIATVGCIIVSGCGGSMSSDVVSDAKEPVSNTTIDSAEGLQVDVLTELETGFQELTFGNVYIVDGNDKKISGSEVAMNTTFSIIYEGIKNYTLKDGKAFPGLAILVSDGNQNVVVDEADLLATYSEGLSEGDASVLRATVTTGNPMKPGKYICSVKVVDKNNTDATIMSTWAFDVK